MHPPPTDSERIDLLQREVRELRERITRLEPVRRRTVRARFAAPLERRRAIRWSLTGEQWTGRAGLVLVFLGLVFLFRYSIDQGWITPHVRILLGGGLGAAFLVIGLRLAPRRPTYGALLLAGSVATFYATGWAASYLYQLLDRTIAFGWMAGVTILALQLARRFDQPGLASLGALGGFATPFLLRPGSETVGELVVYTTLVVIWASALYIRRHWRSVLWTYLVGGTAVLAIAAGASEGSERWIVQAALLIVWGAGAAYPFLHEMRRTGDRDPHRKALIPYALELRLLGGGGTAAIISVTANMWGLPDAYTGQLFLAGAALYGAMAWLGTRSPNFVARSAAPVAAALLATGTFLLAGDGALRWFLVAALGGFLLYGGRTTRFRGVEWVGHGLFGVLTIGFVTELLAGDAAPFTPLLWSYIAGIVLGAGAAQFIRQPVVRSGYWVGAHLLALVWLADQFSTLSGDGEWVTIAWGAYGAVLLLAGLEVGRARAKYFPKVQLFAGTALGMAVLKLLVIDMAQVSALIRIPLFLGCGLGLLALSALFSRSLEPIRRGKKTGDTSSGQEPAAATSGQ